MCALYFNWEGKTEGVKMNYTHLKIGFTLTIAVLGILFANNCYKALNSVMIAQNNKLETIYKGMR